MAFSSPPKPSHSTTSPSRGSDVTGYSETTGFSASHTSGKRDVSQFIKYLLDGSGVDESAVDFAALRKEIEQIDYHDDGNDTEVRRTVEAQHQASLAAAQAIVTAALASDKSPERPAMQSQIDLGSAEHLPELASEPASPVVNTAEPVVVEPTQPFIPKPSDFTQEGFQESIKHFLAMADASPNPIWDDSVPLAEGDFSLQPIQGALRDAGFPPLPAHLFTASVPSRSESHGHMLKTLQWTLMNVLQTYTHVRQHNTEMQQSLRALAVDATNMARLLQQTQEDHQLAVEAMTEQRHRDADRIQTLSAQLDNQGGYQSSLAGAVAVSTRENEGLRKDLAKALDEVERWKKHAESIMVESERKKDDEKRRKKQADDIVEAILGRVRRDTKRAGVDWAIVELVQGYEQKMNKLESELRQVRALHADEPAPEIENGRQSAMTQTAEHAVKDADVDADEAEIVERIRRKSVASFEKAKKAMLDEIEELREQLDLVTAAFQDVQEEKEVLKLRLMAVKPGALALSEKRAFQYQLNLEVDRKKMSTKQLVQHDKFHFKLKLYRIDGMTEEECKLLLKNLCSRLDVDQIEALVAVLDDLKKSVQLIPQMQQVLSQSQLMQFIRVVDTLVWSPPEALTAFLHDNQPQLYKAPHKLAETATKLRQWRQMFDTEIEGLKSFRRTVSHLLGYSEKDPAVMKKSVQQLKKMVAEHQIHDIVEKSYTEPLHHAPERQATETTMASLDQLLTQVEDVEQTWERRMSRHRTSTSEKQQ